MSLTRKLIETERKVATFKSDRYEINLQQLFITEEELQDWGSHRHAGWNKTDIRFNAVGILDVEDLEQFNKEVQEATELARQWDSEIKTTKQIPSMKFGLHGMTQNK